MLNIKFIFTDFDGVLTDNKVYVSSDGKETVLCNRSDGIAINAFKKLGIKTIILSTEKNEVVKVRGEKLGVETYFGLEDKKKFLNNLIIKNNIDLSELLYIGNDINDLGAIKMTKYSACPSDSHNEIKKNVSFVLKKKGGEGVLREVSENILDLRLSTILEYNT